MFMEATSTCLLAKPDEVVWFWIGPHEEYETLLYML